MAKRRLRADEGGGAPVRVSVQIDWLTHARIGVAAAMSGMGREEWSARALEQASKHVKIEVDRAGPAGQAAAV